MNILQNKKTLKNYQILESFIAGLKLEGHEVKSIFSGKGNLENAYISKRGSELFLVNFYLPPYQENNVRNYNPLRERKLLLKRKEINYLLNQMQKPGITLVPLRIFSKNRLLKIEIALAKGLKKYEKREKIKKREFERIKQRFMKEKFR